MDKAEPFVSICVPTYNCEKTIARTIESIIKQTYRNMEILVVDNVSTDRTMEIVRSFKDPRMKIHVNEVNIGGEANFTRCFELAVGELTAIFHSDDVYKPEMVARQVEFFCRNSKIGAVFTLAHRIDDEERIIGEDTLPKELIRTPDNIYGFSHVFRAIISDHNFLICSSAMVRTQIYKNEIKRWDVGKFRTSSDLDVWLRILVKHPVGIIPEALMQRRVTAGYSSQFNNLRTGTFDFFLVTEDYLKRDWVRRQLTRSDLKKYQFTRYKDDLERAFSYFIKQDYAKAREFLSRLKSWDTFTTAFTARWRIKNYFYGLVILLLTYTGGNKTLRRLLYRLFCYLRYGSSKKFDFDQI